MESWEFEHWPEIWVRYQGIIISLRYSSVYFKIFPDVITDDQRNVCVCIAGRSNMIRTTDGYFDHWTRLSNLLLVISGILLENVRRNFWFCSALNSRNRNHKIKHFGYEVFSKVAVLSFLRNTPDFNLNFFFQHLFPWTLNSFSLCSRHLVSNMFWTYNRSIESQLWHSQYLTYWHMYHEKSVPWTWGLHVRHSWRLFANGFYTGLRTFSCLKVTKPKLFEVWPLKGQSSHSCGVLPVSQGCSFF